MSKIFKRKKFDKKKLGNFNNKCEECNNEEESLTHNLILTGFKICDSCKISKTIFPV